MVIRLLLGRPGTMRRGRDRAMVRNCMRDKGDSMVMVMVKGSSTRDGDRRSSRDRATSRNCMNDKGSSTRRTRGSITNDEGPSTSAKATVKNYTNAKDTTTAARGSITKEGDPIRVMVKICIRGVTVMRDTAVVIAL